MSLAFSDNRPTRESLPFLVEAAGQRLISAKSSAEVLESKRLAELALHYAKVTKAANETHADCLRIITRAEMRMANEIDRGQEAGEVRSAGQPSIVRTSDNTSASLEDLGVSRQRLSEWRAVRDAGEDVVEETLAVALSEGRAPTKTEIVEAAKGVHNHRAQGTGENEWYTPRVYIEAARDVMGAINLDPASSQIANQIVGAEQFYTLQDDGLVRNWFGNVWLNPPYAQPYIAHFTKKAADEFAAGNIDQAIVLTHNYTDTAWFHTAAGQCTAICFTRGRIGFLDPAGNKAAPTQGQAFFYYGPNVDRFASVFRPFGLIVRRYA